MKVTVGRVGSHAENVGRPTPLGNPFYMATEAMRDDVCDRYEKWFHSKVAADDPEVMGQLRRLWAKGKTSGQLVLGCYCAPKRCHADTIKRFLESY